MLFVFPVILEFRPVRMDLHFCTFCAPGGRADALPQAGPIYDIVYTVELCISLTGNLASIRFISFTTILCLIRYLSGDI